MLLLWMNREGSYETVQSFCRQINVIFGKMRLVLVAMMVAMETMSQMVIVVFNNEHFC